jgi:hypothetical protein
LCREDGKDVADAAVAWLPNLSLAKHGHCSAAFSWAAYEPRVPELSDCCWAPRAALGSCPCCARTCKCLAFCLYLHSLLQPHYILPQRLEWCAASLLELGIAPTGVSPPFTPLSPGDTPHTACGSAAKGAVVGIQIIGVCAV